MLDYQKAKVQPFQILYGYPEQQGCEESIASNYSQQLNTIKWKAYRKQKVIWLLE